jgi:hypothetical protein
MGAYVAVLAFGLYFISQDIWRAGKAKEQYGKARLNLGGPLVVIALVLRLILAPK